MTDQKSSLRFDTTNVATSELGWHLFTDEFVRRGFHSLTRHSWVTDLAKEKVDRWGATKLGHLTTGLLTNVSDSGAEFFGELEGGSILHVNINSNGGVNILLGMETTEPKLAARSIMKLVKIYPLAVPPDDRSVCMSFWMQGPHGPVQINRTIAVPDWGEIAENYSPSTAQGLSTVMANFEPAHGGQLLLWHGPPGTGKTFAIRALALHWREWCSVDCVIDPEVFFGSGGYMMNVLSTGAATAMDGEPKPHKLTKDGGMWRLLILEDAGELLAEDARLQAGQGLSRMLNLSDGLIGQGLKVLLLVTTNEPLKKLHPAVARPGRCASEIEFKPFTEEEASTWLKNRGQVLASAGPQTLAELFGQIEQFSGASGQKRKSLGFQ